MGERVGWRVGVGTIAANAGKACKSQSREVANELLSPIKQFNSFNNRDGQTCRRIAGIRRERRRVNHTPGCCGVLRCGCRLHPCNRPPAANIHAAYSLGMAAHPNRCGNLGHKPLVIYATCHNSSGSFPGVAAGICLDQPTPAWNVAARRRPGVQPVGHRPEWRFHADQSGDSPGNGRTA